MSGYKRGFARLQRCVYEREKEIKRTDERCSECVYGREKESDKTKRKRERSVESFS